MKSWQFSVFAVVALPLFGIALTRPGGPVVNSMPEIPIDVRVTCSDIAKLARGLGETGDTPLAVRMSTACDGAMASIDGRGEAEESLLAWTFLRRLAEFRATVMEINAGRLARASGPARAPIRLVSETGAYLIAAEMGVFDARDAWAEAAGVTLASR